MKNGWDLCEGNMKTSGFMPSRMLFGDEELQIIKEVFEHYREKNVDFGYQGDYEKLYTDAFVKYLEVDGFADAVCTGTAALFVAVASLQLKPGSHVLVSCITDPGTINAIILNQLVPVLCDNAANSYNIGAEEFEKRITDKTKAVIVVHAAGKSAPIDLISEIAKKNDIYVIEDCSQAHGARCGKKRVGTFGHIAAFSTMYRKNHSTGGCGGVVFTQERKRYDLIRSYADRGKPFSKDDFDEKNPATFLFPALNLNIDEISCAIGIKTLSKLDTIIKKRLNFLYELKNALEKYSKTCRILNLSDKDSPFFQPIFVDTSKIACSKIEFAKALQAEGVTINPDYMYVVSEWPWVRPYLSDTYFCENAVKYRDSTFNLLFNENCGRDEVHNIVSAVCKTEIKYILKGIY